MDYLKAHLQAIKLLILANAVNNMAVIAANRNYKPVINTEGLKVQIHPSLQSRPVWVSARLPSVEPPTDHMSIVTKLKGFQITRNEFDRTIIQARWRTSKL